MEFQLLQDMVLILGLAIVVLYIFHRFRIPSVIGFLLTGVITGPHGLNLISNMHDVEVIAEVGVILLLFTIGIEFSLKSLLKIGKILLIGGSFQVMITIAAITLVALRIGNSINESVFIGFLVALSSTAIVLKLIQDKGEIDAPHGRISLGVLIYQDIIIVPMMLLTPILAGNSGGMDSSYWDLDKQGQFDSYEKVDKDTVKFVIQLKPHSQASFAYTVRSYTGTRQEDWRP